MLIINTVLGNVREPLWQERTEKAKVDYLALDQWDAQKNRLRRTTEQGNDIAVSLPRNTFLQNGDVLAFDEAKNEMIVAKIKLRDVLIIEFKELLKREQSELVRLCIEIGHALGNQHWPAVVRDGKIILPLTVDKKVMLSVMRTHAFPDITYDFHPAEVAIPYLLPHEARRLFGGADQGSVDMSHHVHGAHGGHGAVPPGHHSHDGGLTHHADHAAVHEHTHQHADGTVHSHPHDECCGKDDCCDHNHPHPHDHKHQHADGTVHTHPHDECCGKDDCCDHNHPHTHDHKHQHADGTVHSHPHDECCGKDDCCDHNHPHTHDHKHQHADGTVHSHPHDECCGKDDCCDHNHPHTHDECCGKDERCDHGHAHRHAHKHEECRGKSGCCGHGHQH